MRDSLARERKTPERYTRHDSSEAWTARRQSAILRRRCHRRTWEQQYRAADAFSRHDLDAFLAICDPDVELVSRHLQLDGSGHLRGHAAVRRWWETLLTIYPDFTSEIDKVQDLGDVTVARQRFRGHGSTSGVQMEQGQWIVTKWRHNRIVWTRSCPTEAEALEVARDLGVDDESRA